MNSNKAESKWRKLILEFNSSNLTPTEFCKKKKISAGCFYKWKKRYGSEDSISQDFIEVKPQVINGNVPVVVSPKMQMIRITTSNGTILEIPL